MNTKLTKVEREAVRNLGGAASISRSIGEHEKLSLRFSAMREDLVARYPNQWVALHRDGDVCIGASLEELLRECDQRGFEKGSAVLRFLDAEKQTFIL